MLARVSGVAVAQLEFLDDLPHWIVHPNLERGTFALVQLTVNSTIDRCNRTKVPNYRIIFHRSSSASGNPAPIKCIR